MDARKLYRTILKLYPARFREEYGKPLEQQFSDEYSEAEGNRARFGLWLHTLGDLCVSIPLEFARELRQDLGYSIRIYSRRPGITVLAVAAMALAIGATTGVFSVVNALLLRSLPFRSPERIVQLGFAFSGPDKPAAFHNWRAGCTYLEDATKYSLNEVNLTGSESSTRVKLSETAANFFSVLGLEPEIGRSFASAEDTPGKNSVAVISYGLWQTFFGGDPRALGSTIHLNGSPLSVIGIMPAGFDYPAKSAIWTPTVFEVEKIPKSGAIFSIGIGRLKAGLSLASAQSMFDAEQEHLAAGSLKRNVGNPLKLLALREQLAGPVRKASLALLGAVSFVLLVACANVANLLLTRITERRRELVLRAALGASRARLLQQLITETVLLTGISAVAGMLVAQWAVRLATVAQPAQISAQEYTILDWRVVIFAVSLAALTGLLFGVLPASLIGRLQPADGLVRTPVDASDTRVRRLRACLLAVQAALTLTLLGGSIVMGRGFLKMLHADLGYRTDHVVTMSVSLAGAGYKDARRTQYYRDALDRIRRVPGVQSAGAIDSLPLATQAFIGENAKLDSGREIKFTSVMWASSDYFRTMDSAILYGRDFVPSDQGSPVRAVIVNEEFAREAGESQTLIGRTMKSGFAGGNLTIVGIVRDVHYFATTGEKQLAAMFLLPDRQAPSYMTFVARVRGNTEAYLPVCRDAIQSVDRHVPVFNAKTLDQRLDAKLGAPRFYTSAVLFFAGFALLLAIIGIYSVASFSILQRTHELGVRIAIGASAERMRWMLCRQSMLPVVVGMVAGVCGAMSLDRLLQTMVGAVKGIDVLTCAMAALVLALVAGIAVWSATQRILRLDPLEVLRAE
jgi:putative ABC transport system permease protein